MGNQITKTVRCDSSDPTILPPPPPMGVHGSSSSLPGSGDPGQIPPTGPPVNEKFKDNPGIMDDFHKKTKDVFPMPMEGCKIIIGKQLSSTFQVSHHLTMSQIQPSGYRFGATYVGNMFTPYDPTCLVMGDIDPSGNLNAQGFYNISEALKIKWGSQIMKNKYQGLQMSLDYRGPRWTLSGCLVNPNITNESGIGIAQYLHTITPRVVLGGEVMHQRSPAIPGGSMTAATASAKYSDEVNTVSGFIGHVGGGLYVYRRLNEDLQIGFEIEKTRDDFNASLGYQYEVPKANFAMKGMIDTSWTVTGMFEKRLLPMPCMFSICASINHVKNQFRIGCGVNVEL